MTQINLQAATKSPVQTSAKESTRLYFVDHLRAALVILVVLHHVAVVYGEGVSFWYVDPPIGESLGGFLLVLFVLFNQAWFMGALFLLAGYFTPGSFERKGAASFLKGRLIRLGIPLALWMFVLNPLSSIGLFLDPAPRIPVPLTWESYWLLYPEFIGLGVAWFLALLLIFSIGYAAWRQLAGRRHAPTSREYTVPSYRRIGLFVLALALITYLVRIVIPLGRTVLDFPTLAYLPQYLSFFIAGAIAYRGDWLRTMPGRMGKVGLAMAVVATLCLFPIPMLGMLGGTMRFLGNGSWPSAVYALWDSAFATGMCLASIIFFRRYFNNNSGLGRFLSQQSYAVYIIHSPIIVFLAYALFLAYARNGINLGPLLKFGAAAAITIPICFALAWLIRKIPGATRVL